MTRHTEIALSGEVGIAGGIGSGGGVTPALDLPSGLSGPGASFLTGQNGKERLAWSSYSPAPGVGSGTSSAESFSGPPVS